MSTERHLQANHKILGSGYCPGYTDIFGKWNTGFYCPGGDTYEVFYCCGTENYKYCCIYRPNATQEEEENDNLPLILGIVFGAVAAITIVTVVSCFYCHCCILYKKRQAQTSGGPVYRMHSSSTESGVANIYSCSGQTSCVTTPLDSQRPHLLSEPEDIPAPNCTEHTLQLMYGCGDQNYRTRPSVSSPSLYQNGEVTREDNTWYPHVTRQHVEPPPSYYSSRSPYVSRQEQTLPSISRYVPPAEPASYCDFPRSVRTEQSTRISHQDRPGQNINCIPTTSEQTLRHTIKL